MVSAAVGLWAACAFSEADGPAGALPGSNSREVQRFPLWPPSAGTPVPELGGRWLGRSGVVKASHVTGANVPLDPPGLSGPRNFLRQNSCCQGHVSSGSSSDGLWVLSPQVQARPLRSGVPELSTLPAGPRSCGLGWVCQQFPHKQPPSMGRARKVDLVLSEVVAAAK